MISSIEGYPDVKYKSMFVSTYPDIHVINGYGIRRGEKKGKNHIMIKLVLIPA